RTKIKMQPRINMNPHDMTLASKLRIPHSALRIHSNGAPLLTSLSAQNASPSKRSKQKGGSSAHTPSPHSISSVPLPPAGRSSNASGSGTSSTSHRPDWTGNADTTSPSQPRPSPTTRQASASLLTTGPATYTSPAASDAVWSSPTSGGTSSTAFSTSPTPNTASRSHSTARL